MLGSNFEDLFGKMKPEDRAKAAKTFQGLLNGFYQAAIDGTYDLNDISASV